MARTEPNRFVAQVDPALEHQVLDFLSDEGNRTYIITTKRITSGEELK